MSDETEQPRRVVRRSSFVYWLSKFGARAFAKVWLRHRAEGAQHVPAEGPVLLVANHTSYLDPLVVGICLPRSVAYLAQAGLARLAPLRWWMAKVGVTLIDRTAPSKTALRLVADSLRAGEVVGLFAEGTRSRDGRIAPFRSGVEFLARRAGVVVPVGVDGAVRAMPRGCWFPRPRKVVVRIGEPWPAERVLAPGGVEALRRRVAELARCELADTDVAAAPGSRPDPERARSSQSASAGGGA
jgi:1-acyl-sn-glycerol-3-phosphate acyltransferase